MKKQSSLGKKVIIIAFVIISVILILVMSAFFFIYFSVDLDEKSINTDRSNIKILDNTNDEIETLNSNTYVKYENISNNIINAFIALEDKRFFKHNGVDYIRLGGAIVNNIKAGYFKEGGSTITQQLAKNAQFSSEKTLERKIKELKVAKDIEKKYTKEEIIELYLNHIYFGAGIYGIDSACKNYFNKKPDKIELYEGAILAGIVKNPSKYSPFSNTDAINDRKNLVLKLMHEQGYITSKDYEININRIYKRIDKKLDINTSYYNNTIYEASKLLGITENELLSGGYTIKTYYDKEEQKILFNGLTSRDFSAKSNNGNDCGRSALLCDNTTGGIEGYFSNIDVNLDEFYKQPGSVIKPINIYAPALEKKEIYSCSPFNDEKTSINGYSPDNYANNYLGWITAKEGLSTSSNSLAVQILDKTGIEYSKNVSSQMGLKYANSDKSYAIGLGGLTKGNTTRELTESYMTLANGGYYTKNSFIMSIMDKNGNIIYENNAPKRYVIKDSTAFIVTDMLVNTAKNGTAKALKGLPFDVASKTGTVGYGDTKNNTDAWNVSYTTDNTLCVWYGGINNSYENSVSVTGGGLPTHFAKYVHNNISPLNKNFSAPLSVTRLEIDKKNTLLEGKVLLANDYTPASYKENHYFDINNVPKETSQEFIKMQDINIIIEKNRLFVQHPYTNNYDYKLIQTDKFGNLSVSYEGLINDNNVEFLTSKLKKFGIYEFYIEAYKDKKHIYTTDKKIVFT